MNTTEERLITFKNVIKDFNNGLGTITELTKNRENYTSNMFYIDMKKYNVMKDIKKNKYIYKESYSDNTDSLKENKKDYKEKRKIKQITLNQVTINFL